MKSPPGITKPPGIGGMEQVLIAAETVHHLRAVA
jgi:hypothetical protein